MANNNIKFELPEEININKIYCIIEGNKLVYYTINRIDISQQIYSDLNGNSINRTHIRLFYSNEYYHGFNINEISYTEDSINIPSKGIYFNIDDLVSNLYNTASYFSDKGKSDKADTEKLSE